jgi:hypothetical protein
VGDDAAVVEDGDLVGQGVRLVQVLRGQQDGGALRDQAAHGHPDLVPLGRVEPGGRLVQEDHRRPADQARSQVEAPPHAPGVRLGGPVGRLGEVEVGQQLGGPALRVGRAQVEQPADQHQVLGSGQVVVDGGVLPGQPDQAAYPPGVGDHVEPTDPGNAAVRAQQRGQHPDRRRLARTVRAEHAEHGSGADREVHSGQRGGLAEPLHQALGLDRVHGALLSRRGRGSSAALARCAQAAVSGWQRLAALAAVPFGPPAGLMS